ncbi:MAG: ABC transporter ATP-binding protein [Archaeoglobaceae archaeon]
MLAINQVSKKFGSIVALDRVSFKVDNECLGIIGPNGAGKTTLFNAISGFLKPDSGRIEFRGNHVNSKKPNHMVKMGLVRTFQLIKVFKNMSVEENILAPNSRNGASGILERVELVDKSHMPARNLSQGELRRLSIGIALAAHPKMLLLDEPFSGLSSKEATKLDQVIKELKDDGISQIIIEHKLKELFNLSERVVVLNFGKVIFDGSPEEAVQDKKVVNAYLGAKDVEN